MLGLTATALAAGLAGCSGQSGSDTASEESAANTDGGADDDETAAGGDASTDTTAQPTDATAQPTDTQAMETTQASDGPASPEGMTSEVPELTIVSAEQDRTEEGDPRGAGDWLTRLEVRNTGDQETDLFEYSYEVTLYDADGNEIETTIAKSSTGAESDAVPGGTGTLELSDTEDVDPDDVARFEVTLECGVLAEGVYCE